MNDWSHFFWIIMTIDEIVFQANPANRDPRQRTILVAIDKSANSHYAFLWAMEHLIKPETDLVILLHVNPVVETPEPCLSRNWIKIEPSKHKFHLKISGTTFVDFSHYIAEMEEQLRQKAHGLLTSHAHALMDRKIHVKAVVMRGGWFYSNILNTMITDEPWLRYIRCCCWNLQESSGVECELFGDGQSWSGSLSKCLDGLCIQLLYNTCPMYVCCHSPSIGCWGHARLGVNRFEMVWEQIYWDYNVIWYLSTATAPAHVIL